MELLFHVAFTQQKVAVAAQLDIVDPRIGVERFLCDSGDTGAALLLVLVVERADELEVEVAETRFNVIVDADVVALFIMTSVSGFHTSFNEAGREETSIPNEFI